MCIGEKIRFYREKRQLSQAQLSILSGIPLDTIKKYELSYRTPKRDVLEKISTALDVSIHVFDDDSINFVSDLFSYLFRISELGEIEFYGKKNNDDTYDADTLSISFNSHIIKKYLKIWADRKEVINNLCENAHKTPDKKTKEFLFNRANELESDFILEMLSSKQPINNEKK